MLQGCLAKFVTALTADSEPEEEEERRPVESAAVTVKDYRRHPEWFHERQVQAWKSGAIDIVLVAGTGGGKTAAQAPWILRETQRCAPLIKMLGRGKGIYAGPTLTLLEEQAINYVEDLLQFEEELGRLTRGNKPKFKFSREGLKKILGFSDCPVEITFRYTNDASNLESMVGIWGCWDEAGQKENKVASFRAFNRRLKIARSATFGQVWDWIVKSGFQEQLQWWHDTYFLDEGPDATFGRRLWGTTPYEWNWFKTEIYDKAQALRGSRVWDFFNFPSWMNPNISREECEAEKDRMPLWEWQMMYEGLYTRPAGLVFDCFDSLNVCEPFVIPKEWKRWLGGDFGGINTAAVYIAEDPQSRELVQYAEYWPQRSRTTQEHYDAIQATAKAADPAAGTVSSGAGGQRNEEGDREAYRAKGLSLDEPPNIGVKAQYQCVYDQIKPKKLRIFKTCAKTIEMYQTFSRVLDGENQPTDEFKDEAKYHLLAGSRYIISKLRPSKRANIDNALDALRALTNKAS